MIPDLCQYCDRSAREPGHDLCRSCAFIRDAEVRRLSQILKDCDELVATSRNPETRIYRCDLAIQTLQQLMRWDLLGIDTIDPRPCAQLVEWEQRRTDVLTFR